jgi:hypothetical protein
MDIRQTVATGTEKLEGRVQPELDLIKAKLGAANDQVMSFVRAHPAQCVLGAVALGFLVGRIARSGWFAPAKGTA